MQNDRCIESVQPYFPEHRRPFEQGHGLQIDKEFAEGRQSVFTIRLKDHHILHGSRQGIRVHAHGSDGDLALQVLAELADSHQTDDGRENEKSHEGIANQDEAGGQGTFLPARQSLQTVHYL